MAIHALAQHLGVDARVARHERRPEAGRERRRRLLDADLGAGQLGRVAADEVVHRLVARQPADGRQDAERVGGQEDDRRRLAGHAVLGAVADVVQREGGARVLGELLRVEIELARRRIDVDVLEDRAEALRGRVDVGLVDVAEPDGLGVAAALEVEDALVAPAVLVVADQDALRIGAERRLAGAAQAEEDGHVAVLGRR